MTNTRSIQGEKGTETQAGGSNASSSSPPARLLIADDHDLVREGLLAVLEGEPDLQVVGEARNGKEAIEMARQLRPDLVLMDVRMPEMDGLAATRAIKEELPQTSVVMVTMHENPDYLLEAIRAGAAGYILKDAAGERLVEAVRRTLEGEVPLNEGLAMRLLQRLAGEEEEGHRAGGARGASRGEAPARKPPAPPAEELTEREAEVLRLLAQGRTNPQIARTVLSSVSTVKVHVQNIIAKLGVSDRTQAAVRAIELGLATSGLEEEGNLRRQRGMF
jgi:two-component system, NarL family, response regulator LiaR